MIRSPDDFEPSLELSLHDDAIAHVFSGEDRKSTRLNSSHT